MFGVYIMKFFYLLLTLLLFYGCSDNSTTTSTTPVFNISLSPNLAGSFPTLVPVNSQLVVYTTEPIDYTTVNTQTVYLKNLTDATLTISTVQSLSTTTGKAIVIRPVTHLTPSNDYELVVTTDVATAAGEHRSSDAVITFTTGTQLDTTPPALIATLPENITTGSLEKFGIISFQFDEPLSPLSIQNVQINVKENGPSTGPGVAGELILSGSLLSFVPDENLIEGSGYSVELNTTNIVDLAGNAYNASTIETLDFYVPSTPDAKPIVDFVGSTDYNLSAKVNVLTSNQNELFVGTDAGFDILTYENASMVHRSHLEGVKLGTVYSIALDISNQRVYLGTSTGFSAIDISDLNLPTIISHIDTLNANGYYVPVYGLSVSQGHIYLAASSLGVMDINISNIASPTLLNTQNTQAPAFDLTSMDATNLVLSSYGNTLSTINKNTLVETDLAPRSIYSHNIYTQLNANSYTDVLYSAGVRGIGIASDTGTSLNNYFLSSEAYVTRITKHGDNSVAIMKNIGLGYFMASGGIYKYQYLPFNPTAVTYLGNKTALGNDLLILADKTGQIYIQVIN